MRDRCYADAAMRCSLGAMTRTLFTGAAGGRWHRRRSRRGGPGRRGRPHRRDRHAASTATSRSTSPARRVLPGLFDCHTHVVVSSIDTMRLIQTPFSYRFFQAAANLEATLRIGITTVRDAGGADLGVKQAVEDGLVRRTADAHQPQHAEPDRRPRRRLDAVRRLGARAPHRASGRADDDRRRARRDAPEGPRADPDGRRRHQGRHLGRRPVAARQADPRPLPAGGARGARRGGECGRHLRHGSRPGDARASRTRSAPGSARSTTASTSTTRRSR